MKVTIIGAGNMGRALGTLAVAGGNDVELIDRNPADAEALAEELQRSAAGGASASALEPGGDIGGEVVLLALYYPSVAEAAEQYGSQLGGRVVVEMTNPVDSETFDGLTTPPGKSAAEELRERLPHDARVVKAFNTTFARTIAKGEVSGQRLDVLIAGDDDDAKAKVAALAEAGGLDTIDVGPLRRAHQLEELGFLHMALQDRLGTGYTSAVKFIK